MFVSAKSSNDKSIAVYAHGTYASRQSYTCLLCVCGAVTISVCVCVYVCMCLCIYDRGGRSGWMSHIVPVRPSDIAGGQRGMEPERGDSDK